MRVLIASFLLLCLSSVILAAAGKVGYCTAGGSDGCTSTAQVTNTLAWHEVELNDGLAIDEEEEELNTLAAADRKVVVVQETVPHDGSYYAKPTTSSKTYCYTSCEWFAHNDGTNDVTTWNTNQICYGCSNGYIRYEKEADGSCLKFDDLSKVPTAIFDKLAAGCKSLGGCKYCSPKKPVKGKLLQFAQVSKVLADTTSSSNGNGVYVPSARTETTYNQIRGEIQQTRADVQVYKEIPIPPAKILPNQATIEEQVQVINAITSLKLTVDEWRQKFRDTFSLIMDEVHDAVDDIKELKNALRRANSNALNLAETILEERHSTFKKSTDDKQQKKNFAAFIQSLKDEIETTLENSTPGKKIKACREQVKTFAETIKSIRGDVKDKKTTAQQGILNALKIFKQLVDYQDTKCSLDRSSLTLSSTTFKQIANKAYNSRRNYTA